MLLGKSLLVVAVKKRTVSQAEYALMYSYLPYRRKIWRGINLIWRFGSMPFNRQIKIHKIFSACMYVWQYHTIPPNNVIWGKTTKFNDRQYFRLYGIHDDSCQIYIFEV